MFFTIVDFIFLGWFFWPLFAAFSIGSYLCIRGDKDETFSGGALFLIACALAASAVRWPEFRALIFSIKGAALILGIYTAIGGALALWKWLAVLMDFRKAAPEILTQARANKVDSDELRKHLAETIYGYYHGRDKVKESNDGSFYPNSKAFPIATWWVYWPFFFFNVILDPVARFIRYVADLFSNLYENLAKKFFSVR